MANREKVAFVSLLVLAVVMSVVLAGDRPRAVSSAIAPEDIKYDVELIPQPNKDSCWAAAMAMLLSFRQQASFEPESLVKDVGGTLMSSYGWDLLEAVRDRYGFTTIEVPSNSSLYFSPEEWAKWLHDFGPLWAVVVGAPHAVVISGLRGDTEDPASCEVMVLDPWDSRVTFDDDPIEFHPANNGYARWMPFEEFASDFGDIAKFDKDLTYEGNWRVLWLPVK